MDAHGIDILDKAHRYHFVARIPYNFELEFLPANDRFLDENLIYNACRETPSCNGPELFDIVDQTAAGPSHGVCRPDHDRITESLCNLLGILNTVHGFAFWHLNPEPVHGLLEGNTILAPFNCIDVHSDNLYIVFFENAFFCQQR